MKVISISIVCTDKGQHEWTVLGDLAIIGGLLRANQTLVYGALAERRKHECVWLDQLDRGHPNYRAHMQCPRCKRHPQWRHTTAMHALTTMHGAGVTEVDISRLPKQLS